MATKSVDAIGIIMKDGKRFLLTRGLREFGEYAYSVYKLTQSDDTIWSGFIEFHDDKRAFFLEVLKELYWIPHESCDTEDLGNLIWEHIEPDYQFRNNRRKDNGKE